MLSKSFDLQSTCQLANLHTVPEVPRMSRRYMAAPPTPRPRLAQLLDPCASVPAESTACTCIYTSLP